MEEAKENEDWSEREEVMGALRILRSGKTPALDGIAMELFKYGGNNIIKWLLRIFLGICREVLFQSREGNIYQRGRGTIRI